MRVGEELEGPMIHRNDEADTAANPWGNTGDAAKGFQAGAKAALLAGQQSQQRTPEVYGPPLPKSFSSEQAVKMCFAGMSDDTAKNPYRLPSIFDTMKSMTDIPKGPSLVPYNPANTLSEYEQYAILDASCPGDGDSIGGVMYGMPIGQRIMNVLYNDLGERVRTTAGPCIGYDPIEAPQPGRKKIPNR